MSVTNLASYEAWRKLKESSGSYLIDTRTKEEIVFIGYPNLEKLDSHYLAIELAFYPNMKINDRFIDVLNNTIENKENEIFFICRSGARSAMAAELAVNAGYKNCYNVVDGFEGELDSYSQRNNIAGWKFNKLPWKQN